MAAPLESLSEIGDALTGELELEPLLGLVARRLRTWSMRDSY